MLQISPTQSQWHWPFSIDAPQKNKDIAPLDQLTKVCTDLCKRIAAAVAGTFYTIADAADRIRRGSDGLDKLLKLLSSTSVAAMLIPGTDASFFGDLSAQFRSIDRMFSGVSVFGRYNELMRLDKNGHRAISHKGPFKEANVVFLTIAKSFEFISLLRGLGLVCVESLKNVDARILGGCAQQMGQLPILRHFVSAGLTGCKNQFLVAASTYAIVNNTVLLLEGNASTFEIKRAILGTLQDSGKIYLCTAVFTVSWTWAAIAMLTAVFGLTKILVDSYEASRIKGENVGYPEWIQALKV